jgi:hypothetical protein
MQAHHEFSTFHHIPSFAKMTDPAVDKDKRDRNKPKRPDGRPIGDDPSD